MKSWGCCLREPVPYETRERWSFSPPCWGLNERLPSANQGESLPGNYPASTWTLDFPAPRSLRNQFPLFKPPSLWHLLQQPILTRQQVYLICDNSSHSVPMTCALHHMCATFQNTRKGKAVTAETAPPPHPVPLQLFSCCSCITHTATSGCPAIFWTTSFESLSLLLTTQILNLWIMWLWEVYLKPQAPVGIKL